jgi:HD-GYP domain-containing protein (c-di-GMP phosphodiesterase class II)
MTDGRFEPSGRRIIDDELGQLEADVARLARRSEQLVDVLDALNGAKTLREAVDRLPLRIKRQFMVGWLGLVEIHDGRMRLRLSRPGLDELGLTPVEGGWPLGGTLLDEVCRINQSSFAVLRNGDGLLSQSDPLLRQLADAGLAAVALLPVREDGQVIAGVMLGSRNPDAFTGWRQRWLQNVGHLIASALHRSIHIEHLGLSMVRGLAELAEHRDPTTGRHLERMQRYAGIIARELVRRGAVDPRQLPRFAEQVETFAPLHDIGKVGISDRILLKTGPLTVEERADMQRHPVIGAQVLMAVAERLGIEGERLLAHGMDIALYHHERYDGGGYPNGLVGKAIPLSARIVAVADVFDALTSERPYKPAWSEADALDYLRAETGSFFDPEVIDAFLSVMEEIRETRKRLGDSQRLGR